MTGSVTEDMMDLPDGTDLEAYRASEMVVRLSEAGPGTRVDLAVETIDGQKCLLRVDSGDLRWDDSLGEDGGAAGSLQVTARALPTWLRDLGGEGRKATHGLYVDSTGETADSVEMDEVDSGYPPVEMRTTDENDENPRQAAVGIIRAVKPARSR